MKVLVFLLCLPMICLTACGQSPTASAQSQKSPQPFASGRQDGGHGVLTAQEVAAILGSPVTSVEGAASDMEYKTDTLALQTTIAIEAENNSEEAMVGARKATQMLGGTPEELANLGDEAFFGAMSVLYVRKGEHVITITPPNFQQIAAMAAYGKVTDASMGSAEQAKAMQELVQIEKADPLQAGLKGGDATQGALATVAAASKKQGTAQEDRGRAVARALAAKVLSKL